MKHSVILLMLLAALSLAVPSLAWAEDEAAPAKDAGKDADKKDEAKDEGKKDEGKKDKGEGEGGGEAKKKSPEDVSGGRFAGDPVYVHLSPMILPVISESGAEQIVTLAITLEVKDFETADTVHTKMPLVRDALMQALYGGLGNGSLRNGQLIDVGKVKSKATRALGDALGADSIKDVLIEAVAQRRL